MRGARGSSDIPLIHRICFRPYIRKSPVIARVARRSRSDSGASRIVAQIARKVVDDNGQPLWGPELVRFRISLFATDATRSRGLAVYAIARPELLVVARHDWRRPASLCVHIDILFQGRQATGGAASGRAEERQVNTGKGVYTSAVIWVIYHSGTSLSLALAARTCFT